MRYWFKYNVIWSGPVGELPNVALASVAPFFTDYGTGQFVNGSDNAYLGYVDCDTEANRDIIMNNLSRFSAVLMTDIEVIDHVKVLIPIESNTIEKSDTGIDVVKTVDNISMVDGFPKISSTAKG